MTEDHLSSPPSSSGDHKKNRGVMKVPSASQIKTNETIFLLDYKRRAGQKRQWLRCKVNDQFFKDDFNRNVEGEIQTSV